jgi:hypothetical protein
VANSVWRRPGRDTASGDVARVPVVLSRRIFDAGLALGSRDQSPLHAPGCHAHVCDEVRVVYVVVMDEGCSDPNEFGGTTATGANLGHLIHPAKGSPWHI